MQDRIYSRISRELVLIPLPFFPPFLSTVLSRLLSRIYIPPTSCALKTELGQVCSRDFTLVYVRLR